MIDLDYQGSLTDAVIKKAGELSLGAIDLIEAKADVEKIIKRTEKPIANFRHMEVLASFLPLNRAENRILFKWLVGEERKDIRYNVHGILSSPEIRSRYDLVIIDAPLG